MSEVSERVTILFDVNRRNECKIQNTSSQETRAKGKRKTTDLKFSLLKMTTLNEKKPRQL